jgi:hypothetical protein
MIITSAVEKELNATLAGFFEAVELEPSEALFKARSELKDAYNIATICAIISVTLACFRFISFC